MVSENPELRRQIRENAELKSEDERTVRGDADELCRLQPTVADALLCSHEARGTSVVRDPLVGRAAREVARVCEEYDVPIEPTDVSVFAVQGLGANGTATVYGGGRYTAKRGPNGHEWRVEEDPDGYVIMMNASRRASGVEKTVRHEIAHICGWATEGVTYEQEDNHAEWLSRLDAW